MRAILMYHSIDASGSPISIDAACFERHLTWLADQRDAGRVQVVPLADIAATDADAGGDALAITFDDAFASFETEASAGTWPSWSVHHTVLCEEFHDGVHVVPVVSIDELFEVSERYFCIALHCCAPGYLTALRLRLQYLPLRQATQSLLSDMTMRNNGGMEYSSNAGT